MPKGEDEMKKLFREEGGFTLIELLVTIAILGVLFGIVTLTLGGLSTQAQANSCTAELAVVQSAVDIYMAANLLSAVPARAAAAVINTGDADAPFNIYLRSMPTEGTYTWTAPGAVTQAVCP
jgi:prepilin-type N-terminal cleavage/methylation domain-containing protein